MKFKTHAKRANRKKNQQAWSLTSLNEIRVTLFFHGDDNKRGKKFNINLKKKNTKKKLTRIIIIHFLFPVARREQYIQEKKL